MIQYFIGQCNSRFFVILKLVFDTFSDNTYFCSVMQQLTQHAYTRYFFTKLDIGCVVIIESLKIWNILGIMLFSQVSIVCLKFGACNVWAVCFCQ